MRRFRCALLGLVVAIAVPSPAVAIEVDLELVLAIDVSRSIDEEEARLQRQGYIGAITHKRIVQALQSGPLRRIAVAYVEWAGEHYQRTVVGWTLLDDAASAEAFAAKIALASPASANWTSISGAIDYAARLFDDNGFEGTRRIIDISGDGVNNHGRSVVAARDEAVAKGITVNGLPILNERPNFSRPAEVGLDLYYERFVIGGPGAFLVAATDFASFAAAILGKLIREIAHAPDGAGR
ncbi:MAG: DUF1194 domain-containing protein [Pseudomonadota bacterium]